MKAVTGKNTDTEREEEGTDGRQEVLRQTHGFRRKFLKIMGIIFRNHAESGSGRFLNIIFWELFQKVLGAQW